MNPAARSMAAPAIALAVGAGALVRPGAGRPWIAAGLAVGLAVAWALRGVRTPNVRGPLFVLAAALFVAATFRSPSGLDGALGSWFSPNGGLIYWNPALWLGLAGAFLAADDLRPALGVLLMSLYACLPGSPFLAGLAPGLLVPGAVRTADVLRRQAERRPLGAVAAGLAALVVWNFLFMEQYRRNLIPRDDTVSFADVASHNAALFTHAFGAPISWPAIWVFAARHRVGVDHYEDALGLHPSFAGVDTETIDLAAPPPTALLLDGWSEPGPAPSEPAMRALTVDADLLVLLPAAATLDVSVQMAGAGTLVMQVNGASGLVLPVPADLTDVRVRVGAERWCAGYNRLTLAPSAGTSVRLSRIVLRQVGGRI